MPQINSPTTVVLFKKQKCIIKIFWGGRGGDTFKTPPLPYEQLLALPTPSFKMFLERSLNDPPPHLKHLSLLPPPHPPPLPPKKILIIHKIGLMRQWNPGKDNAA